MTPTSIRLGPEIKERIKRLAGATERSEARLIRYALELGLRQLEADQQPTVRKGETTMTVCATDGRFSSPDTPHLAVRVPGSLTAWRVTYLPQDKHLTRPQAMTAMQLAAVVGASEEHITTADPIYKMVASWAAELGLEAADAIAAAERPRRWGA